MSLWSVLIEDDCGFSQSFIFDNEKVANDFRDMVWEPLTARDFAVYHVVPQGTPHASVLAAILACDTIDEIRDEDEAEGDHPDRWRLVA